MQGAVTRSNGKVILWNRWTTPNYERGDHIFDVEVRNSLGERVLQRFQQRWTQENESVHLRFAIDESELKSGDYVVSLGVFRPNWGESIAWSASSATFSVGESPRRAEPTTSVAPPAPQPSPPPAEGNGAPAKGNGNLLSGKSLYGKNTDALAQAEEWRNSRPGDAALMERLGNAPTAAWLGDWTTDVRAEAAKIVDESTKAGKVAVLVAYNIPGRDCGSYSAGGAAGESAYDAWIDRLAAGIGSAEAIVIVEPDALAQLCGDIAGRYRMLNHAVEALSRNPQTLTYLDAGHGKWINAPEMASRLRQAGVAKARGFALNVSNFQTTEDNVAHGEALARLVGGKHYVIDTSRNGRGPLGQEWCNPSGRALGRYPMTTPGPASADAYLWIKTPGQSDGSCNGGPSAGKFWPGYALDLARATWG